MNRTTALAALSDPTPWDILIIGGGATGLGIAVDAAARGYRTVLFEQYDFAKGTSSRSTKLIHGGVRYLQRGQFRLVAEALRERALLRHNAPHLVSQQPFLVPCYKWSELSYYWLGLKAYDSLGGKHKWPRSQRISRDAAIERMPTLRTKGLRGGIVYLDGQFDDARLAIALARTAADCGATVVNYMPVRRLLKHANHICGVVVQDAESGREYEVQSRAVISATGIFTDEIRKQDEPESSAAIVYSQGVHLVFDASYLPGNTALMIPRTDDRRVLFAIPWQGRVIVGTTDTPVPAAVIEPRPLESEIDFLLTHAARYLTRPPRREDALSTYAGIRPLFKAHGRAKETLSVSREHAVIVSKSRLITVTGGKWTTYRAMAQDAVDKAIEIAHLPASECRTHNLLLHGATHDALPTAVNDDAFVRYGTDAANVKELVAAGPNWEALIHEHLPYRIVDIVWAARHEMARAVEDVLARRTRALLMNAAASMQAAPLVAEVLARELGRDHEWQQAQVEAFRGLAQGYLVTL